MCTYSNISSIELNSYLSQINLNSKFNVIILDTKSKKWEVKVITAPKDCFRKAKELFATDFLCTDVSSGVGQHEFLLGKLCICT